jgi:ABC-type dipeptide/oligopeptide/nickel transport system permease component
MEGIRRQRWWISRVILLPIYLFVFTVGTFFLIRTIPGDPVLAVLGSNWTPASYLKMKATLGLDGSVWQQLGTYLGNLAHFDLGTSISDGKPVITTLAAAFPATLELALQALIVTIVVSALASYVVVMHPKNLGARVLRTYARAAGAVPEYVLAVAGLLLFYATLHWVPAPIGRMDPLIDSPDFVTGAPVLDGVLTGDWSAVGSMIAHLVLPIGVMVLAQSALLIKLLTASLEEQLDAAPTRFRIAAGASRPAVMLSVYRRALPPAVTMCGTLFGYLLGGAIIIESLFGFSGLGTFAVSAVSSTDYPSLQAFLLVVAAMTLGLFLVVDIVNMLIDPRRRPGVRTEDA